MQITEMHWKHVFFNYLKKLKKKEEEVEIGLQHSYLIIIIITTNTLWRQPRS